MNICKRVGSLMLSLLLVFSLLSSTLAVQTYAATAPALSVESKSVSPGEQFTIAVNLANATSVYGGNFTLQYDSNLLTADFFAFGSIVGGHTKNCNLDYQSAGNLIRFTFSGASALTSSGTLVTFTFTAKQSVSGSAALKFTAYKMYDENGSAITSTANGSTITISSKPVVSPSISITNKTVTIGETVSVPIMISNSSDVYGGNFTLQYDSNLLTAESYSFGSIVSGHTKNCNLNYQSAGNLIRVTFSGASAVSSDGTLVTLTFTAKAEGTSALQFTAYKMYDENGSSIATTVSNGNVTVEQKTTKTLTSISVQSNPTKTTYYIGDSLNTSGLQLKLTYSDGSNETVTSGYTTSGFSSTSAGTKTVTVSYDGKTTTFTVTVNTPSISLSSASKSMTVGDTATLTATTLPNGQAVTWVSSDTSVATVSGGTITAKATGTATITAKFTYNGITYSKPCSLKVELNTTNVITGQCGPNAYYSLNLDAHSLSITGAGSLDGWSESSTAPWFKYTHNVRDVTIAEGITCIPSYSFYYCSQIVDVSIPNTVTNIGYKAFSYCWSLDKIELPESLEEIGQFAFYGCSKLTTILIPKNVDNIISINAFGGCASLKMIDVDLENVKFTSVDGILYNKSKTKLLRCPCGYEKKVSVFDGVKTIDEGAFKDCQIIEHITLSNSVTTINEDAFFDCKNLKTIYLSNKLEKIYSYAFYYCTSLTDIAIPDSTNYIGDKAFMGCSNLKQVDLSNITCSALYNYVFAYCTNMQTFVFPKGVSRIYVGAFSSCESLKELVLPDSVTVIEDSAFANCIGLEKITIPKSVTTIYSDSFKKCNSLTIYGYENTEAETYANDESIPFIALDGKELTSISIVQNPFKTTYYIGDSLNTSGLTLKLTYSDGSTETVKSGFTTSGFSSTSAGTKTITVEYGGKSTTFTVTVNTPTVSLSLTSKSMTVGDTETLTATTTPSGQSVTWTSSNTSVATVSGGTITAKAAGTATITAKFTYNGISYSKTCSITVTSAPELEPTLSSISIATKPTKTTYEIGESLNTSGLTLKLTYSDGSTKTVSSGFTTSGFSSATAGTKTVKVTYSGKSTNFTVIVSEPVIDQNKPCVTIERKSARVGSTVSITVNLQNNPGIWGMDLAVNYDKSQLTLTNVTNGTVFSSSEWMQGSLSGDKYILSYEASGFEDNTTNGVLATLEFTVNENATADSFSDISLSYNTGDIINVNFDDIEMSVVSGGINITNFIYGDLNGDGLVNKKDSLLMKMYLADNSTVIDKKAADVYADGIINKKDSLYLKQYLAGLDVELGA